MARKADNGSALASSFAARDDTSLKSEAAKAVRTSTHLLVRSVSHDAGSEGGSAVM